MRRFKSHGGLCIHALRLPYDASMSLSLSKPSKLIECKVKAFLPKTGLFIKHCPRCNRKRSWRRFAMSSLSDSLGQGGKKDCSPRLAAEYLLAICTWLDHP